MGFRGKKFAVSYWAQLFTLPPSLTRHLFTSCLRIIGGPEKGAYYHPQFRSGQFDSLALVKRIATNKKKNFTQQKASSNKSADRDVKGSSKPSSNDTPHIQSEKPPAAMGNPPPFNDVDALLPVEQVKRVFNQNAHPGSSEVSTSSNTDDLVIEAISLEREVVSFSTASYLLRALDVECIDVNDRSLDFNQFSNSVDPEHQEDDEFSQFINVTLASFVE